MKKILVLGAGPVGKAIACRLFDYGHKITIVDQNFDTVKDLVGTKYKSIKFCSRNMNPAYKIHINDTFCGQNLIINALPGSISDGVITQLMPCGVDIIDVSFSERDMRELNIHAKEYKVNVIYDCGIAPGLCNIILGYHTRKHKVLSYECYVGGLPKRPLAPLYHEALFSVEDMMAEYTRSARFKIHGFQEKVDPLSSIAIKDFVWWQKDINRKLYSAFISDGLRSLLDLDIPDMREYTLRYPEHMVQMQYLKDLGFLDQKNINNTIKVLSKHLKSSSLDDMIMEIKIGGDNKEYVYSLYDEANDGISAMARTTGYTCACIAHMKLQGIISVPNGVCPPEHLPIDHKLLRSLFTELRNEGIDIKTPTQTP